MPLETLYVGSSRGRLGRNGERWIKISSSGNINTSVSTNRISSDTSSGDNSIRDRFTCL